MKSKKKLLIPALVLALLAALSVAAFAYFSLARESEPGLSLDTTAEVIEVSDFGQLFAAVQDSLYNNGAPVSGITKTGRKTVKLTADIALSADLEITADVHLSLGGHDLDLAGHCLTIRHGYAGSVVVSDGRILVSDSGNEAVYADTPRAAVLFSGVTVGTLTDGTFTEAADRVHFLSADLSYIAYNFFYMTAASLGDATCLPAARETYAGASGKTAFTALDFFRLPRDGCTDHPGVPCAYLLSDIDLPQHYPGYPGLTVSYTTGGVLSPEGKRLGTGRDTVTASVSLSSAPDTVYTVSFPVHLPDVSTTDKQLSLAQTLVTRHLDRYWVESTTDGTDTTTVQKYVINRDCYLPSGFSGLPFSVSWYAYDENGDAVFSGAAENGAATVRFVPTTSAVTLRAVLKNADGTEAAQADYPMTSANTVTVKSAVTIANDLLRKWYGTAITITASGNGDYIYSAGTGDGTPLSYLPLYDHDYYTTYDNGLYARAYPGVRAIRYSVVYGDAADEYYAIGSGNADEMWERLSVVAGKPEDDAGAVYLNVTMTVEYNGRTSDAVIQLPIRCVLSGDSDGLSRFLPYYSLFDKTFLELTGGYSLSDFDMPFSYRRELPVVCYGFAATDGTTAALDALRNALSLVFVDKDGGETVLDGRVLSVTDTDGTERTFLSFSDAMDALYSSAALQAQATGGTAHYRIAIDKTKLPANNLGLSLIYQYKSAWTMTEWATYNDTSDMTVPGVIRYGEHIPDANFYTWMYNAFRLSGNAISAPGDTVILTDWLSRNVALDYEADADTYLHAVTDFTGLQYMTGTQTLRLKGSAVLTAANIREIAKMKSLVTLDLSDCSLSFGTSSASPFAAWTEAGSALVNLTSLDLRSNEIFDFAWLEDLCRNVARSLVSVTLSGNVPTTNDADKVFYGSDGLCNFGTYRELASQGISVYSAGSAANPVSFSDSRSASQVYLNLCSLAYRDKLPASESLADMILDFSTNAADYGITNTVRNSTVADGCAITNPTISFATAGETAFTLTFSATAGGKTYAVTLKFAVSRV